MLLEKIYVGMDLHKNTSSFCVKDKEGKILDQEKVKTTPEEVSGYLKKHTTGTVSLALEPVSQWYFYADLIESLGIDVHLAHATKVKAIASARVKTDKIDAAVLADLLRTNLLPEAYRSPKEVRCWKETVRFRASLVNQRTQVKNKLYALLSRNGKAYDGVSLFTKRGVLWIRELPLLAPYDRSRDQYLRLLQTLDTLIQEATTDVEVRVAHHKEAMLLTTIPGFSYITALTAMAEIGDISRFPTAKQLMSYAGLVPSTYASGEKVRHGRITKNGSRWLRWTFIEAAHAQGRLKKKHGLTVYYRNIRKRKHAGAAAVATARKLCAVSWRMLTDSRPFEDRAPELGHITDSS